MRVNDYSTGWLSRGFPWVYRDEVDGGAEHRQAGDVVEIVGADGRSRGTGIWAEDGRVAVRRFRADPGPVDDALVAARVAAARARRPLPPDTTAWRWVHGENDDLPGIRVDAWGTELSVALDSPSLECLLPGLRDALRRLHADATAIWLVARPDPRDAEDRPGRILWGEPAEDGVEVTEHGLRFRVRPGRSHDVGLYCDMRDLRAWLRPYLAGRRVLNLFAHTGAFSVHAAAHGAGEVVTVDLSSRYLARARDNFRLNGLDPESHRFVAADSLAALDRLRRKGERFDLVIADPPSFSHGPRGEWSVTADLGKLVAACCRVLAPGGWLLVASNHGGLSPRDFGRLVQQGALKAGRPLRLLHEGSTPVDFPAALSFPESRYLKCWVLEG
ncbi:MAG: class I SAM-dependent rRNA methyltransferase [Deltaproteobacteria bacterium]|nr:MAG: class I SAM-dependent rRNA methyltransferase [Deltaproteobacteria bacterium]